MPSSSRISVCQCMHSTETGRAQIERPIWRENLKDSKYYRKRFHRSGTAHWQLCNGMLLESADELGQSLPVLLKTSYNLDGLKHIDNVIDATALYLKLLGSIIQRDDVLLVAAVHVEKLCAEQPQRFVLSTIGGDAALTLRDGHCSRHL